MIQDQKIIEDLNLMNRAGVIIHEYGIERKKFDLIISRNNESPNEIWIMPITKRKLHYLGLDCCNSYLPAHEDGHEINPTIEGIFTTYRGFFPAEGRNIQQLSLNVGEGTKNFKLSTILPMNLLHEDIKKRLGKNSQRLSYKPFHVNNWEQKY
jgi:hypothetical protein